MTRGKMILITDKAVLISTEWNGDMYPEGNGIDAFKRMLRVNSLGTFLMEVTEFNTEYFNYENELVYEESLEWLDKAKDFSEGYYDNWFSDWLYIKNISSKPIIFKAKIDIDLAEAPATEDRVIMPDEVSVFNFGSNPSQEDKDYLEKNL